jgi:serine/threonine protein kinase
MAPEMLQSNRKYGFTVDVWMIGTMIYTMLIGSRPFKSEEDETLCKEIKDAKIHFPNEIVISDAAKDLILKILNPNPSMFSPLLAYIILIFFRRKTDFR